MPGESALRSIPAEKRAEHEETGLPGPGRTAGAGAKVGCLGYSAVKLEIKVESRRERARGSWKDGERAQADGG